MKNVIKKRHVYGSVFLFEDKICNSVIDLRQKVRKQYIRNFLY